MKLSKNFSLSEFTKSQTAIRKGIDNNPSEIQLEKIKDLVENILQPLRDKFGPVRISSGFRSFDLNKAIGGSQTSQHSKGEAADIEIPGVDNKELVEYIRENIEFDQLILEFYEEGIPDSGWVHVSYKDSGRRKQVLKAYKKDGKTRYMVI